MSWWEVGHSKKLNLKTSQTHLNLEFYASPKGFDIIIAFGYHKGVEIPITQKPPAVKFVDEFILCLTLSSILYMIIFKHKHHIEELLLR